MSNILNGNENIADDSVREGINFLKIGNGRLCEKLHKDGDDKTEAWGDNYYFPTHEELQDYKKTYKLQLPYYSKAYLSCVIPFVMKTNCPVSAPVMK